MTTSFVNHVENKLNTNREKQKQIQDEIESRQKRIGELMKLKNSKRSKQ